MGGGRQIEEKSIARFSATQSVAWRMKIKQTSNEHQTNAVWSKAI
jgi:hypothetical protein